MKRGFVPAKVVIRGQISKYFLLLPERICGTGFVPKGCGRGAFGRLGSPLVAKTQYRASLFVDFCFMNRKNTIRHWFGTLVLWLLFAAAWLGRFASSVSPLRGDFWTLAAMSLPLAVALNAAALVVCALRRRWMRGLLPLTALVVNLSYLSAVFGLPHFGMENKRCGIRIMTLNAHGFMQPGPPCETARAVARLAEEEQVDVLCLQEADMGPGCPADTLAALFAVRMPYFKQEGDFAVASRFPMADRRGCSSSEIGNGYLRTDLLVRGDTLRLLTVHLQTTGISTLLAQKREAEGARVGVREVCASLVRNSRIRAQQADSLVHEIEASPYPVLLAGDFNDMPSSYVYRRVRRALTDGFQSVGEGFGATFRDLGGMLRIDYIFYDDRFTAARYRTLDEEVSDHKAVVADVIVL